MFVQNARLRRAGTNEDCVCLALPCRRVLDSPRLTCRPIYWYQIILDLVLLQWG